MADSNRRHNKGHVSENQEFEGNFQVQAPGGLIFGGAISRKVFCVTSLGGLIFGGAYFRNFTVFMKRLSYGTSNFAAG